MRYPRNYFPVKRCFYKRLQTGAGQPPVAATPQAAGGRKGNGLEWGYGRKQHKREAQ